MRIKYSVCNIISNDAWHVIQTGRAVVIFSFMGSIFDEKPLDETSSQPPGAQDT